MFICHKLATSLSFNQGYHCLILWYMFGVGLFYVHAYLRLAHCVHQASCKFLTFRFIKSWNYILNLITIWIYCMMYDCIKHYLVTNSIRCAAFPIIALTFTSLLVVKGYNYLLKSSIRLQFCLTLFIRTYMILLFELIFTLTFVLLRYFL